MAIDAGTILARMALDRRGFSQAVAAVKGETEGLKGNLTSQFKSIFKLGAALTGVVAGLASAIGVAAIKVAQQGDAYEKLSLRTGWTVEALSTLAYAAGQSDATLGDVEIGLRTLAVQMEGARGGNAELAKTFRDLGVPLKQTDGSLRSQQDVLYDLADAMARTESETRRMALAQELFGRGGLALMPLLRSGAAGMRELEAQGVRLGAQWTTLQAEQGTALGDRLDDLKVAVGGLVRACVTGLIPMMTDVVGSLAEWVAANRELVSTRVKEFAEGLVKVFGELIEVLRDLPGSLLSADDAGVKLLATLSSVLLILQSIAVIGRSIANVFAGLAALILKLQQLFAYSQPGLWGTGVIKQLGDASKAAEDFALRMQEANRETGASMRATRTGQQAWQMTGVPKPNELAVKFLWDKDTMKKELAEELLGLFGEARQEVLRKIRSDAHRAALELQLAR